MFVVDGEKLGSIIRDDPSGKPKKAAKQAKVAELTDTEKEADEQAAATRAALAAVPDEAVEEEVDEEVVPPRNASRDVWAEFLDGQEIEYDEEAGRNDLVDLWYES